MRKSGEYKPGDFYPNGLEVLEVSEEVVRALCISESIVVTPCDMWSSYSRKRSKFTFDKEPGGDMELGNRVTEEAPFGTYKVGHEYDLTIETHKTLVPAHETTQVGHVTRIDAVNLLG